MGRPSRDHCELSGCTLGEKCLGASVWSTTDFLNVAKCMVAPEGAGSSVALGRGRGCSPPGGSGRQDGRIRFGPRASHGCCPSSRMGRSMGPWHRKDWLSAQFLALGGRPGAQADSLREDGPLRPTLPKRGLSRQPLVLLGPSSHWPWEGGWGGS